jgi:hypothetical protein
MALKRLKNKTDDKPESQEKDVEILTADVIQPDNLTGLPMMQWKWPAFVKHMKRNPYFVVKTTVAINAVALQRQAKRTNLKIQVKRFQYNPGNRTDYLIYRKEVEPVLRQFPFWKTTYGVGPILFQDLFKGAEVEIPGRKLRINVYNRVLSCLRKDLKWLGIYNKFRVRHGRNALVWNESEIRKDVWKVKICEEILRAKTNGNGG